MERTKQKGEKKVCGGEKSVSTRETVPERKVFASIQAEAFITGE